MPQNQAHVDHPIEGADPTKLFVFVDVDTQRDLVSDEDHAKPLSNIRQLIQCAVECDQPIISTLSGGDKQSGTEIEGAQRLETDQDVPDPLSVQTILTAEAKPTSHPLFKTVARRVYGRTAIVFGACIDGDVREMTLKLRSLGLPCRVISDACTARDEAQRATAEREIIESGTVIVPTDEMIPFVREQLGLSL